MKNTIKPGASVLAKSGPFRTSPDVLVPGDLVAHQIGGHLALDFCNTAGEHLAERPDEMLRDWESFLRWATQVAIIGSESYLELLRYPESVAPIAQLREAIYRVGLAIAGSRRLSEQDLAFIREQAKDSGLRSNSVTRQSSGNLLRGMRRSSYAQYSQARRCRYGARQSSTHRDLRRRPCGWLFLDGSRGKRRRWCDMNDCGSRAKARRYYEKQKGL